MRRSRPIRDVIHAVVSERAWNEELSSFTATLDGKTLDASLLLLNEMGFVEADDPRFAMIGLITCAMRLSVPWDRAF